MQPASTWLRDLWAKVVVGRQPPLDARVLLAGDQVNQVMWDPTAGGVLVLTGPELWTHLRLLFCRAVWHLRCCRVAHGQAFTAAAVSDSLVLLFLRPGVCVCA